MAVALTRTLRRSITVAAHAAVSKHVRVVCLPQEHDVPQLDSQAEVDLWSAVFGNSACSAYVAQVDETFPSPDQFLDETSRNGAAYAAPWAKEDEEDAQEARMDLWGVVFGPKDDQPELEQTQATTADEVDKYTFTRDGDEEDEAKEKDLWSSVFGAKQPECLREDPVEEVEESAPIALREHDDVWTSVFGSRDI